MDTYDLLNNIVKNEKYRLSASLFSDEDREKLEENDKLIYDLLKNISSLGSKITNTGITFHPMLVMADGRRTFAVEDITEKQYELLSNISFERIPLVLRALLTDILWTLKKNYLCSKIAAKSYWELFLLWYTDEDNAGTLDMVRRALCIAKQTKYIELSSEIYQWKDNFIHNKAASIDGFFSLRFMELFAEQKDCDMVPFLTVLDLIIQGNIDDVSKVEQAYDLKTYCYNKLKNKEEASKSNLLLAQYYWDYAEKTVSENIQGAMRASAYFQKSVTLFRNNGQPQTAELVHKRLVEVQKDIPRLMVPISLELDIKGIVDNIKLNMEELSFEESIIRMTQMFTFDKQEDIKKTVFEELKCSPLAHMFGKNLINDKGQTVLSLPPLDMQNPESNMNLLELYMHQSALKKQCLAGDIWIKNSLYLIRERYQFERQQVDFLIKDNPIIPEGREKIFQSGIYYFLKGDYYEALHILAPQTENLFRNIALDVGGLTVTLENDGSSMEKVLSSIFSLPELLDCYDNDILFVFKGLLNEQAGANIRNEIAHGIITEYACSTGVCLYFGVAVIKLLSFTSIQCWKILKSSTKLKQYIAPNKDALQVIKKSKNP